MYKPSIEVHELRKLFPYYNLLDLQIRMLKNGIQVILTENGIRLEDVVAASPPPSRLLLPVRTSTVGATSPR